MPLIGNVVKQIAKKVLISLWLTAATSPADVAIHKKMFGLGNTTLILSNKELNVNMKIVKSLEACGLSIKGVSETFKNEAKKQKVGILIMLLDTSGATLLGNLLTFKGTISTDEGTFRVDEGTVRASQF